MAAMAEDGTNKFLALKNITTGFPVILISTNGGVSYAAIYEPGAGDANNVVATNGKILIHGNFGTNVNIIDYNGGALDDISITGLGAGTTINAVVYNSLDDTYYATVDGIQDLYKRTAGVWALVNAGLNFDGAKIIGLFSGEDVLYIGGVSGIASKFSTSINGGVTLVDKTGALLGASALALGGVVNVTA